MHFEDEKKNHKLRRVNILEVSLILIAFGLLIFNSGQLMKIQIKWTFLQFSDLPQWSHDNQFLTNKIKVT